MSFVITVRPIQKSQIPFGQKMIGFFSGKSISYEVFVFIFKLNQDSVLCFFPEVSFF